MKKIFTFVLLVFVMFNLSAQKGLDWIKIDSPKDDYIFRYFFNYSEGALKAIFTIPEVKPFQPVKSQIFVRTFNADLSKFDEQGLPSESPIELSVKGFKDLIVVYGSTDENKNPFLQYHKDNKIVIADAQLNPLKVFLYPTHGKKNKFQGIPSVATSYDSTYLMVINNEVLESESKPFKETPVMHYINVFDKSGNIAWNDSIRLSDIFGKDVPINSYSFEFINKKMYLIASTAGFGMKKIKPELFVVRYDSPGSFKIIARKIFTSSQFGWEKAITKDGHMFIAGLNREQSITSKKNLFFINIDLKADDGSPVIKSIAVDKTLLVKYPAYKSTLPNNLTEPSDLLLLKDGLLYVSEAHIISTTTSSNHSSTTYYVKGISLIKFDFEGNIEWIKVMDKSIASGTAFYPYFCRAFVSNGEVVLFYYDYLEDILQAKPGPKLRFISESSFCMAQATVDAEGNIKKSFIYKIGEDGTRADLSTMEQLSSTRYFITGTGIKIKTRGGFAAFYDLKE